jgi:large subunit ribosomal protein L4
VAAEKKDVKSDAQAKAAVSAAEGKTAGVSKAAPKAKTAPKAKAAPKAAPAKKVTKPAAKPVAKKVAKPAAKPVAKKVAKPAAQKAAKPAAKPAAAAAVEPAVEEVSKAAAAKPVAKPAARKVAKKVARKVAKPKPVKIELKAGGPLEAAVIDGEGRQVGTVALNESRFAVPADVGMLHLVVRAEQARRRRGTASSKSRGEVSGSTAKLYRQKGTGRARVGSAKSPTRTGGGVAFGPHPRSFDIKINRKVARKALAMALTDRAEGGSVIVARGIELETPSTAAVDRLLASLDIPVPVLVVTSDEPVISKSVRNLRYAETSEVLALSTEKILRARSLVLTEKAFEALNQA